MIVRLKLDDLDLKFRVLFDFFNSHMVSHVMDIELSRLFD
jgi:hypothetical protein